VTLLVFWHLLAQIPRVSFAPLGHRPMKADVKKGSCLGLLNGSHSGSASFTMLFAMMAH